MSGISLIGFENKTSLADYSSTQSENTESLRLKRLIERDERRLSQLEKESREYEKLETELEDYKNQLSQIEENGGMSESEKKRRFDSFEDSECQTCENRRYVDVSDDPGVSFQSPTHISPSAAGSAVRAHENQHVTRNRNEAEKNGKQIVSQTVTIHTAVCPECGKTYVAGGVTKTVTKADTSSDMSQRYSAGKSDGGENKGSAFDTVA